MKKILLPILFVIILFFMSFIANKNRVYDKTYSMDSYYRIKVTEITDVKVKNQSSTDVNIYITTYFRGKIISKDNKGTEIKASVTEVDNGYLNENNSYDVKEGDIVWVEKTADEYDYHTFVMRDRTIPVFILTIFLVLTLFLFGGKQGIKTLFTLVITCFAILGVLLPSMLSGQNTLFWTILVSIYIIIATLASLNGFSKKSISAMISCLAGATVVFLFSLIFQRYFHLSGYTDTSAIYLKELVSNIRLDYILISGIVIGSIGAIMDVAVELSSSIYELYIKSKDNSIKSLIKSGFNIGKDMIGTMSNTLVMAYIGSSVLSILIIIRCGYSLDFIFSIEVIAGEVMQILIGSLGILFTIPLTVIISSILYNKKLGK